MRWVSRWAPSIRTAFVASSVVGACASESGEHTREIAGTAASAGLSGGAAGTTESGGTSAESGGASGGGGSAGAGASSMNDGSGGNAGADTTTPPREPLRHRPAPDVCLQERPPGNFDPDAGAFSAVCSSDSDCADGGVNGRCTLTLWGSNVCTYDECFSDDDCGSGLVCNCRESLFFSDPNALRVGIIEETQNRCSWGGNCRVDADCGPSGWCSPTRDAGCYWGMLAYYCHTPNDECIDDEDCPVLENSFGFCAYDRQKAHWVCGTQICHDAATVPAP